MGRINYRELESAEDELLMMAEKLKILHAETEAIIRKTCAIAMRTGSNQEDWEEAVRSGNVFSKDQLMRVRELQAVSESLSREAPALRKASESLHNVIHIYKRAEEDVLDIYTGEYQVIPRTKFGTSHFGKLNDFEKLIPVSAGGQSDDPSFSESIRHKGLPKENDPGETDTVMTMSDEFLI